jgi:hypothetical protein
VLSGRSQWPRDLKRGSAAARLLGLWVRIPPGARMSVSCECCVLSGRRFCVELITRSGVQECEREASIMKTAWPTSGCRGMEKKSAVFVIDR